MKKKLLNRNNTELLLKAQLESFEIAKYLPRNNSSALPVKLTGTNTHTHKKKKHKNIQLHHNIAIQSLTLMVIK